MGFAITAIEPLINLLSLAIEKYSNCQCLIYEEKLFIVKLKIGKVFQS